MIHSYPVALIDIDFPPEPLPKEAVWNYSDAAGGLEATGEMREPILPAYVSHDIYASSMIEAVTHLATVRRDEALVQKAPRDKLVAQYGDETEMVIDRARENIPKAKAEAREAFFAASGVAHLLGARDGLTVSERETRRRMESSWNSFAKLSSEERDHIRAHLKKIAMKEHSHWAA